MPTILGASLDRRKAKKSRRRLKLCNRPLPGGFCERIWLMPKAFLIAALLVLGQKPQETGIVMGIVVPPVSQQISPPVQVILLPAQYRDLWNSDLQKRLDVYWEHYKPAFARRKEFFFEVSKQA